MKRLWMSVPIVALALAGFAPVAQASGTNTSGEQAGTACGATANMWGGAAGVLQPGEEDWYDASYSEVGGRTLELESTALGWPTSGDGTSVILYAWDQATDTCTKIQATGCSLGFTFIGGVPEVFNIRPCWDVEHIPGVPFIYNRPPGGTINVPGPGDYQVSVRQADNGLASDPIVYTLGDAG